MPRARNIKPGFFKNEVLASLDAKDRLLFIGLWTLADKAGRLEDRPKRIKAEIFPYEEHDCEAGLAHLADYGFIIRYVADGGNFIQIPTWNKHQRPHHQEVPSEIPPPTSDNVLSAERLEKTSHLKAKSFEPKSEELRAQTRSASHLNAKDFALIPDTGYLIPDAGFRELPSLPEQQPEPEKAAARRQPDFDWSEPDPTQLIRAKVEQFAEAWLEPGNVPRAAAAAEREFVKSNSAVVDWLGKIQVSFDRWTEHHAQKRFRDRKHFIPHLERWFFDGDYSRRPPGQGLAVVVAAEPACGVCGGAGMVYPDPPPELQNTARLDWILANGTNCVACGGKND
jgi:hypothetical protein